MKLKLFKHGNWKFVLRICSFFVLYLSVNYANAQIRELTCTNNETNFITTFQIDKKNKKITHLTSLSTDTKQKFVLNSEVTTLSFNDDTAISLNYSSNGKILNLFVFNFIKLIYTQSGHYLDANQKPYSQLFECVLN